MEICLSGLLRGPRKGGLRGKSVFLYQYPPKFRPPCVLVCLVGGYTLYTLVLQYQTKTGLSKALALPCTFLLTV